jgi:hypothetical protein
MSCLSLRVAGAASFLICLSALAATSSCAETHSHTESPSEPKRVVVAEPALQAMVIGTIDKEHLTTQGYPFSKIGDAFDAFKPDLVLVQVRPDAAKDNKLEDAPIEQTYVNDVVGSRGIDMEPIDWFHEMEMGMPLPSPESTDAEAYKRDAGWLDTYEPMSFEQANSRETSERILSALNARARYLGGNALWEKRQAWIQHNAGEAMKKHKGVRRVMVVIQVMHRPELEMYLQNMGAVIRNAADVVAKATETREAGTVPAPVVARWREELNRLRDKLDHAPKKGPERVPILAKMQILQVAVDKAGACCVPPSLLVPRKPGE